MNDLDLDESGRIWVGESLRGVFWRTISATIVLIIRFWRVISATIVLVIRFLLVISVTRVLVYVWSIKLLLFLTIPHFGLLYCSIAKVQLVITQVSLKLSLLFIEIYWVGRCLSIPMSWSYSGEMLEPNIFLISTLPLCGSASLLFLLILRAILRLGRSRIHCNELVLIR